MLLFPLKHPWKRKLVSMAQALAVLNRLLTNDAVYIVAIHKPKNKRKLEIDQTISTKNLDGNSQALEDSPSINQSLPSQSSEFVSLFCYGTGPKWAHGRLDIPFPLSSCAETAIRSGINKRINE